MFDTQALSIKLYLEIMEEIEETLLCVLAAGVPVNMIVVRPPELKLDGNAVSLIAAIGFRS